MANQSKLKSEKAYLTVSKLYQDFRKLFSKHRPDLILILVVIMEIFSVAIAAVFNNLPIAHLYGGEVAAGSMDEILDTLLQKCLIFILYQQEKNRKKESNNGKPKKYFSCRKFRSVKMSKN